MIIDTGSDWLWVDNRNCSNCPSGFALFDERTSETFAYEDSSRTLNYGSGSLTTRKAYD